jgi:hypothetical protein
MRRSPVRGRRGIRRTEGRRGVALALALVALVVLALLAEGAFHASAVALSTSEGAELEARAFAAAENGLGWSVGARAPTITLPPPLGMRIGETRDAWVSTGRDSARVRTTRLAPRTFWVVSEGRAARADGAPHAMRLASALLRLAVADPSPQAAVTAAGDVWVGGSTQVRGGGLTPPGWIECDTLGPSTVGHAGILVASGRTVSVEPGASVTGSPTPGSPATAEDAAAGSPSTYTDFEDEDWAALARRADIEVSGVVEPAPSASAGVCDTSGSRTLSNWGEPWRGAGSVVACSTYFPVILAPASLAVSAGAGRESSSSRKISAWMDGSNSPASSSCAAPSTSRQALARWYCAAHCSSRVMGERR